MNGSVKTESAKELIPGANLVDCSIFGVLSPHNWTQTFGVDLGIKLRQSRKGQAGKKWHADTTYIKVEGRWCYLYRAVDKQGNLVDVYLSDVRDQAAAEAFFVQCHQTTGAVPDQLTTDYFG